MSWWRVGLILGVGLLGGTVFYLAGLPLAWMLGSMSVCIAAALSGARPLVPLGLRKVMLAILGVMLGSAFSPQLLDQAAHWSLSLGVLLLSMAVATTLVMAYFRRVAHMDLPTAYFSAAPGGVNEMVVTGAALGGDERTIALIHFLRILMIVCTVPFVFRLVTGVHSAPLSRSMGSLLDLAPADGLILLACAGGGALIGRLVRLPASGLLGPMLASAIIHVAGLTASHPPSELIIAAQIVTGSGLGCRLVGLNWRHLAAAARIATGSTLILITIAAGASGLLSAVSGLPFSMLMLSFVPGGLAEMSLIALSLGEDVAFVSTHHVLRVILVIACAPLVFRLLKIRFRP